MRFKNKNRLGLDEIIMNPLTPPEIVSLQSKLYKNSNKIQKRKYTFTISSIILTIVLFYIFKNLFINYNIQTFSEKGFLILIAGIFSIVLSTIMFYLLVHIYKFNKIPLLFKNMHKYSEAFRECLFIDYSVVNHNTIVTNFFKEITENQKRKILNFEYQLIIEFNSKIVKV